MRRIFPDYTYGHAPRARCWWDDTIPAPDWPALNQDMRVDVAIIGGGFTGIHAALRLAQSGVSVVVCESGPPGFGASGRNGGFCCLGGGKVTNTDLIRTVGIDGKCHYRQTEVAAIDFVASLIDRFDIDADVHSQGETLLAHRRRIADGFQMDAEQIAEDYGVTAQIHTDPAADGLGTACFGALTTPIGFGLNPRKYLFGVARAAQAAGAQLCSDTRVQSIEPNGTSHHLITDGGRIHADKVIIATNGYSSEDLPDWLGGRFMPAQSSVVVTRPLTRAERQAQGWTSRQMTYDSRNMLHYFRLMPDDRFLFGMRGGILSSPRADALALDRVRRDFETMFPAWAHVETPHGWSGMVCLSRTKTPFIGAVPGAPGHYAALCYHGNGVAMGSFAGHLIAGEVLNTDPDAIPEAMRRILSRIPFGRYRRILIPGAYLAFGLQDL